MTSQKKIILSNIFSAYFLLLLPYGATRVFGQSLPNLQTDTVSRKSNISVATNESLVAKSECLPQDKPFFDSLIMHRCNYDAGGYDQTFAYIDTVPDIVRKLFPNVIFFNNYIWIDADTKPKLSAYYNGSSYSNAARLFNGLFKEVNNTQDYNLEDKITAFLYMFYGFNSNINIIEVKDCNIDVPYSPYTFNIQVNAIINSSNLNLLFYIKNYQFLDFIEIDINNKVKRSLSPDETP